jgi:hypothetical protein
VGLSQQAITVARLPRLGLGTVSSAGAVEHLACQAQAAAESAESWRAAVDCLAQWLSEQKGQALQMQVVLSGRFVRWQLLPWRIELSGRAELTAYAALRFRETYGKAVQGWSILPAALAPGHTAPAAAVDRGLVDALNALCKTHGAQLQALTPYFSSAFDTWHGGIKGQAAWFGTVESDMLTLGLLQGGQWTALQTQRLSGDWRAPLNALMAQIALSCDVPDAAQPEGKLPLYLAGDLPAPVAQPDMPFTWFAPKPLTERNTPGLRLAMGR